MGIIKVEKMNINNVVSNLNLLNDLSPESVYSLFSFYVEAHESLRDDDVRFICGEKNNKLFIGILGVINGLINDGVIGMDIDYEQKKIKEFFVFKSPFENENSMKNEIFDIAKRIKEEAILNSCKYSLAKSLFWNQEIIKVCDEMEKIKSLEPVAYITKDKKQIIFSDSPNMMPQDKTGLIPLYDIR